MPDTIRSRSLLTVVAALVAPWFASCASSPDEGSGFSFDLVYDSTTLKDVELDFVDSTLTDRDSDIDRQRIEARFEWGGPSFRGGFMLIGEALGDEMPLGANEEVDLYGLGGRLAGNPVLFGERDSYSDVPIVILPYEVDAAITWGEDDGAIDEAGTAELRASLGVGIEWYGFQPSVGVAASGIWGYIDDLTGDANIDFVAFTPGLYGGARYAIPGTPVVLQGRAILGDLEGVEFGAGVLF